VSKIAVEGYEMWGFDTTFLSEFVGTSKGVCAL